VAQLGVEQVGVVVGNEGVAQSDAGHDIGDDEAIRSAEMRQEALSHDGHDPVHLVNDMLRLDVHDPSQ